MSAIYLDHAATTPLDPAVREAMAPLFADEFGNPSSRHSLGVRAAEKIDEARRRVARALGARPENVVFTSGGTEADNLAVLGIARARRGPGAHVIVGPTEHPAVRDPALALRKEGFEVETGRLTASGALDLEHFGSLLRAETVLVSQMLANNEFGSVYDVAAVARLVRARAPRARVHVDAVQALGKLECSPDELGVDCVTLSAHKVHGPKGSGALVFADAAVRRTLEPLVFGGGQQEGLRSGTENVAGAVGLGIAAEAAEAARVDACSHFDELRGLLRERLNAIDGARLLEPGAEDIPPIPSIAAIFVPGMDAEILVNQLASRGVFVSAGAACSANKTGPNPALLALGLGEQDARRVVRVSFSRHTTRAEVEQALDLLAEAVSELRAKTGRTTPKSR